MEFLRPERFSLATFLLLGCGTEELNPPPEWPGWNDGRVAYWARGPDEAPLPELCFVDVATGEQTCASMQEGRGSPWSLASGGDIVVLDTRGSWYVAFNATTGERIGIIEGNDCSPVTALATEPTGDRIALSTPTGRCSEPGMALEVIRIDAEPSRYSAAMTDVRTVAESEGTIWDSAWSPSGEALAFTSELPNESWRVEQVDLASGVVLELLALPAIEEGSLSAPVLAADGVSFAASLGSTVHTGRGAFELDDRVRDMHWSPDSAILLASTSVGSIWSIDTETGTIEPLVLADPRAALIGWSQSGSGRQFLEGCGEDGVLLWGTGSDGRCLEGVNSASWSPDQDLLLLRATPPYVADLNARVLRALEPGFEPRWVRD